MFVYCHTDADCIEPQLNPCDGGGCIGDRINIPGYEPVCGNGYVDLNESCDDGNTDDGDGCSSSCQLGSTEDDPATPGDDRPGYVECSQLSPSITCATATICCYAGSPWASSCTETTDECDSFDLCDGPEDCNGGLRCGEQDGVSLCTRFPGAFVRCHTDADCSDPASNPCIEGTCLP
jgi:cysteine-rich repeat protein